MTSSEINFVVSLAGFDETSGQTVHARGVFAAQDVRFGEEYEDIISVDEQGLRHIDYSKIDATRPCARPRRIRTFRWVNLSFSQRKVIQLATGLSSSMTPR